MTLSFFSLCILIGLITTPDGVFNSTFNGMHDTIMEEQGKQCAFYSSQILFDFQ
ncbi:hypothetical protein SLEP1_g34162 [Rubroshorea leprosula]|uniref:Uncharacterized protein n=1 Tax=Rubroshorea leprosula TaxID=152421 RepID=A0AAV5KIY2_9ROSI|nr:hypothetical protein SLEP1_g34162 [Rubroshorea leprosula]